MYKLVGNHKYKAGSSGTVTLPGGAVLLQVSAYAASGGSVVIFGGDSIPLPDNTLFRLQFLHRLAVAEKAPTIVFGSTTTYFVEYIEVG